VRAEGAVHLGEVARDLSLIARALVGHRFASLAVGEAAGGEVDLRVSLPPGRQAVVEYEKAILALICICKSCRVLIDSMIHDLFVRMRVEEGEGGGEWNELQN
jgi:hypothetical protein